MKIIAIGGGEIGRPGFPIETRKIDKEIISLSGKKNPRFLFVPTASSDSESYFNTAKKYFGGKLKCQVDCLYLMNKKLSKKEIREKILNSDIIYVGGGNTLKMMNVWRRQGVDKLILKAGKQGTILSGVSAGAICWFKYGSSDSRKFPNKEAGYIKVSGIGIINALCCPHYDIEFDRQKSLKNTSKNLKEVSIAIENCCALEIVDDKYRIINSNSKAKAYKVYWKNGKYHKEIIVQKKTFSPLNDLIIK